MFINIFYAGKIHKQQQNFSSEKDDFFIHFNSVALFAEFIAIGKRKYKINFYKYT
jgi:hypothetical protein